MTPQELKNSILQLAIQGKLVEQRPEEGTAEELYRQIQEEKQKLIKEGKIKKEKPLPEITEDEKPFDIPETWKWVRVQDLFNVRSAMRIHQTDWRTSGIPFFRGRELVQLANTGKADFEIYISKELYEQNKKKGGVPQKDDILITAVGTLGKVYIVKGIREFYYKDAYILCFENFGHVYPDYIKYALESPYLQGDIHRDSMATTVAQLTIIKAKSLLIPLPPLAEQKRIVAKIEELLPLINRYEKAWTRLEEFNKRFPDDLQKSLLQMAIQGKLVEQRPEEGTGEELYQQIQKEKQELIRAGKIKKEKLLPEIAEEEKPFDIPESWRWAKLCNVAYLTSGNQYDELECGIPYIKVADMNLPDNRMEITTSTRYASENNGSIIPIFSIVFPKRGGAISTNKKRMVLKFPIFVDSNTMGMTCIYSDMFEYMKVWFDSVDLGKLQSGTSVPQINNKDLYPLLIPLPPLAEQKRIVAKLEELLPPCEKLKS